MAILGVEIAVLELLLALSMFLVGIFEIGPFETTIVGSSKVFAKYLNSIPEF
jgi:hypothetical protein